MDPQVVALVAVACLVIAALVYTQVISPRRRRQAIGAALGRAGWRPVAESDAPGWAAVMALAVGRGQGTEQDVEYEERRGLFTRRVRRQERRSGRVYELYRDGAAVSPRYVAVALHRNRTTTSTTMGRKTRSASGRELWIGEARDLPVAAPKAALRVSAEMMRQAGVSAALAGLLGPALAAEPAPPDPLVDGMRAALLPKIDFLTRALADVYAGPGGWVLTAPLEKGAPRLEGLLALARDVSAALDSPSPAGVG